MTKVMWSNDTRDTNIKILNCYENVDSNIFLFQKLRFTSEIIRGQ